MTVKLVMVKDRYGGWTGERRTPDQRFRVVRRKVEIGQAIEYAVYDEQSPKVVTVIGPHSDVAVQETFANTVTNRLCDARDWIEQAIDSTSAVDRLAWLTRNTDDASAGGT